MHEVAIPETTVREAAGGDVVAFSRLVDRHHASMLRVAYAITTDSEAAKDAVQSAWSVAWRRIGGLRDPGQVRAWLIAIAANEARLEVRRTRRRTVVELSVGAGKRAGNADPPEQIPAIDLQRVLQGLKADERTLLALRFVGGLTSDEIAIHLGLSPSGVRSRLLRLLGRLRGELEHD